MVEFLASCILSLVKAMLLFLLSIFLGGGTSEISVMYKYLANFEIWWDIACFYAINVALR